MISKKKPIDLMNKNLSKSYCHALHPQKIKIKFIFINFLGIFPH